MKTIDLHIHSYYSDGEESPRVLLTAAAKKGFNVFSIADHNYISADQEHLQRLAERQGMLFVQGIEVSCVDRKTRESLHILGYSRFFDIDKINEKLSPIIKGYNTRAKKIIKKLNRKYGAGLDFDKIKKQIPSACVSRNHIVQRLSEFLGDRISPRELLSEVFIEEDNSWMPDSEEAIKIIIESNGIAILAHPGDLVYKGNFENLVDRLANFGLRGIEVYFPKHSPQIIDILKKTAEKYNLIITGGSDWHGKNLSKEEWGVLVPNEIYNKLSELFLRKRLFSGGVIYSSLGMK